MCFLISFLLSNKKLGGVIFPEIIFLLIPHYKEQSKDFEKYEHI